MPRLKDNKLELVAQHIFAGKDVYDASRAAGYPDDATSFVANARRRSHRKDVRARVAELQERAAEKAEVDQTFVILGLKDDLKCRLSTFMPRKGFNGRRTFDLDAVDDEMLDRLPSIAYHKNGAVSRIERPNRPDILMKIARIAGLDRNETADALTGLGDKLDAAIKRFQEAKRARAG